MSKPRLYVVRWRDAHGIKGEDTHADVLKVHRPAIYWTAGTLVHTDTTGVTIAQDLGIPLNDGDETTYRTRTFIPRELIELELDAGPLIRKLRKKKTEVTHA